MVSEILFSSTSSAIIFQTKKIYFDPREFTLFCQCTKVLNITINIQKLDEIIHGFYLCIFDC